MAFFLLATMLSVSSTSALQVHVLTRHGARSPLLKNADDLTESGGELTLVGYKQQEELGKWLSQRYPQPLFDAYHFTSSPTQRTLVSAQGFAAGLFADQSAGALPPPIYSMRPVNDILIRPYDKCPVFHGKLTRLYESSDEWRLLQDSALGLLATLANAFPQYAQGAAIPLKDVWNVFDLLDVARAACENGVDDDKCLAHYQAMADVLSTDDWNRLRVLAHQAEHIKYSTTGDNLLGSPLVSHIVEKMDQADDESSSLHLYSGHYPTILGVLATLQLQLPAADVVPPLASALIIELDGESVTIAYKPGDAANSATLLTLPKRDLQQRLAKRQNLPNDAAWCRACDNDTADVCLLVSKTSPSRGLISVRTTLFLWMGLTLVASLIIVQWRRKVQKMATNINPSVVHCSSGEAELT